jgi:tetratricopeptide (TPR) repeat protein
MKLNTKNITVKQKTVYTIIFSFFVFVSVSQTLEETYRFADEQFEAGNYHSALTEFQRVAFFDTQNQFEDVYQKTGDLFYTTGDFNSAIRNYDIASRLERNDSIKAEIRIKKALCYFKLNNYYFALNELLSITPSQNLTIKNKINLFSAIAWFGVEDYNQALISLSHVINQEDIPELEEIFNHFEKNRKRFSPGKVELMSILFPGLGQVYSGNPGSGINSLVLVGGLAVVAVWAWQTYGLMDALLSVSSWYYRYYTGGIQNARATALNRIAQEREDTYHQIMNLVKNNLIQQQ